MATSSFPKSVLSVDTLKRMGMRRVAWAYSQSYAGTLAQEATEQDGVRGATIRKARIGWTVWGWLPR